MAINPPVKPVKESGWERFKRKHPGFASFLEGTKEFAVGTPARIEQFPNFTPEQEQFLDSIFGAIGTPQQQGSPFQQYMQHLQGPLLPQPDYSHLLPLENRAMSEFQTRIVPSIAERFTAMGSTPRSSGFRGAIGAAGSDLEERLHALRSQYGLQQQQLGLQALGQRGAALGSLANLGLTPRSERAFFPATGGALGGAAAGFGGALPRLLGGK